MEVLLLIAIIAASLGIIVKMSVDIVHLKVHLVAHKQLLNDLFSSPEILKAIQEHGPLKQKYGFTDME